MLTRIWNLVWKEVIQFTRDRVMTTFIFLLPLVQLVLLAQASGQRIGDLRVAILDMDHSAATRQIVARLDNREELIVHTFVDDEEELRALLDRGSADLGVIIPQGLSAALSDPARTAQVQVVVDGSNSIAASIALGAASEALASFGQDRAEERGLTVAAPIDLRTVTYYNPTHNLLHFSIPAQVGFITYQITLAVASLGLARERELGTLEQLIVTPLSRLEVVVGKAIPALGIGAANFLLVMAVTVYYFRVPLRGSFLLLFGITLLFILAEIGWGVLISAVSRTQQQAILLVFILALLDMTFSGYMVPVKNLPLALQWIAQVVPMYHYLNVIRAVMLQGATLATLWPRALALAGLGLAILSVAIRGVSQRLD